MEQKMAGELRFIWLKITRYDYTPISTSKMWTFFKLYEWENSSSNIREPVDHALDEALPVVE